MRCAVDCEFAYEVDEVEAVADSDDDDDDSYDFAITLFSPFFIHTFFFSSFSYFILSNVAYFSYSKFHIRIRIFFSLQEKRNKKNRTNEEVDGGGEFRLTRIELSPRI